MLREVGMSMTMAEQQVSPTLLQHLTAEITRISDEQTEALRMAAFVGMTEEEAREYQQRRKRLAELVHEFAALTSQRLP